MPSIKEYNIKLRSLKNTQKITKTMKMVSVSKLRKAQEAQAKAKQYAQTITELITRIAGSVDDSLHPLLQSKEHLKKALILVYTSDKGLCGGFNNNAHQQALMWINQNRTRYSTIEVSCVGRRSYMFFQQREKVRKYYKDFSGDPQFDRAMAIGEDLTEYFLNNEYGEIFIVYNQFFSPLFQKAVFQKIIPAEPEEIVKKNVGMVRDYLFEPSAKELLNFLIPHFLYFKIYFAFLENWAGEHGARMTAMDNATRNASDLIDRYTLLRNRARQSQITTELTEIISGAEAIK